MKKIKIAIGTLLTVLVSNQFFAQQGLEGIVVEKYYVSDAADSMNAVDQLAPYALKTGSVTYRIYANLLPGYKVIQMFGLVDHPLKFNTTTAFFNDPNYGVSVYQGTSLNNTKKHTTLIDSYLTIGGVCTGQIGVLKSEDTDGTIGNNQGILTNITPELGLPIMGANGQDGLMPGSPIVPNILGAAGRLEEIAIGQDFIAVVDYAHTPDAVSNVLASIREFTTGKVIAVLGCGGDRDPMKRPLMGQALKANADIAIFTSDNPRSENPDDILQAMTAGIDIAQPSKRISDRVEAIAYAVSLAGAGDTVAVLGKGHELGQEIMGQTLDFDDRVVLAKAIEAKR